MPQAIESLPGPEYSDVTESFTWVGDFLADGYAEVLWGPNQGDVNTFYSLPKSGGGRNYFMGHTDQEPQIQKLDVRTGRKSIGWVGAFVDARHSEVLLYDAASDDWWLLSGQSTPNFPRFTAVHVGNTIGFGHAISDGRPFWTGDFDGDGLDEVMFYYPGDGHWFLGKIISNQLTWRLVATTPFSSIGAGYRSWSGRFTQAQQSEILFALSNSAWMLFTMSESQFALHGVGNTSGFGTMSGLPFWVGDFAGDGVDEMLFYQPGDDNWWMGRFSPGASENPVCAQLRNDIANLQTSISELEAEQSAAVNSDNRSVLRRLRTQITAAKTELAGKQTHLTQAGCAVTAPNSFGQMNWQLVGNTIGYGHGLTSDGRPFWVGRFSQDIQDEVLFYYAPAGHWHRGILKGTTMQWTLAGTTSLSIGLDLFSQNAGHAWAGDFDGDGLAELVYRPTNSSDFWMFDFGIGGVTGSQVSPPPAHPATATVPNVIGKSLQTAIAAITGAGLTPRSFNLDSSIVNQIVVSEAPSAGATVPAGTTVNIGCIGAMVGVKTLNFFNCSNNRLHLFTSTDEQTWKDEGNLEPPASGSGVSNCPNKTITFSKKGSVDFMAVNATSFPSTAKPGDADFDSASIMFRAAIPGDPKGVAIQGGISS